MKVTKKSCLELIFKFEWNSTYAHHIEFFLVPNVNLWRDYFHPEIYDSLLNKEVGDSISLTFKRGQLIPPHNEKKIIKIRKKQFDAKKSLKREIVPRLGRFYPKGFLIDIAGIYPENIEPFRIIGVEDDHLYADLNTPISYYDIHCEITILNIREKDCDMGGQFNSWVDNILTFGPGMQTRYLNLPTDFWDETAFSRKDPSKDTIFYEKPRLVGHIDKMASHHIRNFYQKKLKKGMKILDLMSSYESHLPDDMDLIVTGLGLNSEEMKNNHQLKDFIIHDLNENTKLPFDDKIFDAVICNLSIEYLIHPQEIFKEVSRILKEEGYFILTFSNRWFPPKVINLWTELHEFERMGYVLELFILSENFKELNTVSIRNWERPLDDPHFDKTPISDPVYIVWGIRNK